ncbi:hypothetical protein Ae201684P_019255 [Aphanomyces euteiches]|nr:hypothetical protein Ae201684P_019255 [Aphanomyces euteiches]
MHLGPSKQAKQAAAASRSRFGQTPTASGRYEPVAAATHVTTTNPDAQSRSGRNNPAESHGYGSDDDDNDASAFPDSADAQSKLIAELVRQNQYLTEELQSRQFPMQAHEEDDGDDLDEWNLNAAPVGLSSNNGPRLHVLALEPLRRFSGSFRLTVGRTVQDWYNQLRADERSTWKALRASFVREYILSPVPKQEVYYTMRQKENETIREYLFRFNAAATKIGLKYDTVRKHFVDHLRCFCNSLADPSQAKWISSMRFASMDDLKEYLNDQRHTEALREHRSQRGATQSGSNQRQERTKAPRVNHLDAVTSTDMAKLAAAATDSVRAEIFALGLNNHEARREVCRDCGKTHFKLDGLCWSTVFCTLCQRMGHPEINCFKACQLCATPHHKADPCPTRQQAAELKEFLQGLDIPDMPSLNCLNL